MTDNEEIIAAEPANVPSLVVMQIPPPPPQMNASKENKSGRNRTVIVMAVLFILWSLSSFMWLAEPSYLPSTMSTVNKLDSTIFGLAFGVVAAGLFQYNITARIGAIYLLIIRAITIVPLNIFQSIDIVSRRHMSDSYNAGVIGARLIGALFLIVIYCIMIYFLTRPTVKEACNR